MKNFSRLFAAVLLFAAAPALRAGDSVKASSINQKVDALVSQMTLEEKIGQMTQYHEWKQLEKKDVPLVAAGRIGSLLNTFGAKTTNEAQKIAVEQSRLH